ncbi:unnamed protein product [Urochloa humidicola]
MAGGGKHPQRPSWIRRRRGGSKLGGPHGGNDDIDTKSASRSSGEWICVRGHRIRRCGRMRVDPDGNLYVPDSEEDEAPVDPDSNLCVPDSEEDEAPDMEVESSGVDLADSGGTSVASVAIAVGANRVVGDGVDAAAEGIPVDAANVAAEEGDADGVKVEEASGTGKEMQQEVAARLKTLLAHIDPSFRDVFISMLKVLVPAFFDP